MYTPSETDLDVEAFQGIDVLLLGAGVSGTSTARLLQWLGASVTCCDANADARMAIAPLVSKTISIDQAIADIANYDLLVTSPGWQPTAPIFHTAAKRHLPVWGDIELCWRADRAGLLGPPRTWVVVTGTNGKTTTVGMLAAICASAGLAAQACGNIGFPVSEALLQGSQQAPSPGHSVESKNRVDVLVCELSSFQLHWAPSIHPDVGAVLNVDEDHLDWHGSMEAYEDAKSRALTGQIAVVGLDDKRASELGRESSAERVIGFRYEHPQDGEVGLVDGFVVDCAFAGKGQTRVVLPISDITPPTLAGILDAEAATAIALAISIDPSAVAQGLRSFRSAAHRGSLVGEVNGVRYIDDSKATNPHAAALALRTHDHVVWLAGGQLKGAHIDDVVAESAQRLRGVVVIGKDADDFVDAIHRVAPAIAVTRVVTGDDGTNTRPPRAEAQQAMLEAVQLAQDMAEAGDVVLLAPAAASLDMFDSYAHRGDAFSLAVSSLPAEVSP